VLLLPCRFNGKAWLKFEDENGLWGIATVSLSPSLLFVKCHCSIHAMMTVVQLHNTRGMYGAVTLQRCTAAHVHYMLCQAVLETKHTVLRHSVNGIGVKRAT
jgi:hypothetical protein